MAKLSETSETSIAITFLAVHLSTLLRQVLLFIFVRNQKSYLFLAFLLVGLKQQSERKQGIIVNV